MDKNMIYGCESWKLTDKVCRKLNSTCSKMLSTQESILGDLIDKDVNTAISLARDRIEWKKFRPSNRC